MCILFIAIDKHPLYPLIIAANRDEFHDRPTQSSRFWGTDKNILSGIDLKGGGTWMGVTRNGLFGALTNIRDPKRQNDHARSRGELIISWTMHKSGVSNFIDMLKNSADEYNGYNLMFGNVFTRQLQVYNNHSNTIETLASGFYGLSNAYLDKPWPKIEKGKQALSDYCSEHNRLCVDSLFAILSDNTPADDACLPDTGVPYDWEKRLSSIFITSEAYGTRSSTIMLVDKHNQVTWEERVFNRTGDVVECNKFIFNS